MVLGLFCLLLVISGKMGPQRAFPQAQDPIDVSSIPPLYRFPQNLSRAMLNNYENRLGWLYNHEFAIALIVD